MPRYGIISDTHNFFDTQIPALFRGVDHIFHAGDVGARSLLVKLQKIAPVTAVKGNTDDELLGCRENEVLVLEGRKFLVRHIVNPASWDKHVSEQIEKHRPDAVFFGHTHKPLVENRDGILFFNPGSAGQARFGLPRTIALLHCEGDEMTPEFLSLE
jgi:putative phosphoesterase